MKRSQLRKNSRCSSSFTLFTKPPCFLLASSSHSLIRGIHTTTLMTYSISIPLTNFQFLALFTFVDDCD